MFYQPSLKRIQFENPDAWFLEKEGPKKDVGLLHFDILSSLDSQYRPTLLEKTYRFWSEAWKETFKELRVDASSYSDDFLNKEVGGLFLGDQPIALLMYHFIDLRLSLYRDSTYFKDYPKALLNELNRFAGKTLVITYMTVDPQWRRRYTTHSIPEMLIGFSVMRLLESDAVRILGYFRNNRGTQDIFYRHGGEPVLRDAHCYNVDVDYGILEKSKAQLSRYKQTHQIVQTKWNEFKNNQKGVNYAIHRPLERRNDPSYEDSRDVPLGQRELL